MIYHLPHLKYPIIVSVYDASDDSRTNEKNLEFWPVEQIDQCKIGQYIFYDKDNHNLPQHSGRLTVGVIQDIGPVEYEFEFKEHVIIIPKKCDYEYLFCWRRVR